MFTKNMFTKNMLLKEAKAWNFKELVCFMSLTTTQFRPIYYKVFSIPLLQSEHSVQSITFSEALRWNTEDFHHWCFWNCSISHSLTISPIFITPCVSLPSSTAANSQHQLTVGKMNFVLFVRFLVWLTWKDIWYVRPAGEEQLQCTKFLGAKR